MDTEKTMQTHEAATRDVMVLPEIMMTAAGWNAVAEDFDWSDRPFPKRAVVTCGLAVALGLIIAIKMSRRT
jgi:hypothetical protein